MKLIYILLFLIVSTISIARSSVSFDTMGNITAPDSELLILGKKANKKGHTEDANKNFKKAAELGNEQAKVFLANHYINAKNYPNALAWLKLIEPNLIKNNATISQAIDTLSDAMTQQEQNTSQILHDQLKSTYGQSAAQQNRLNWRDQLQFTGTRIRGQIPSQLTVLPVENGMLGTNAITITGHEIRSQLDQYVNAYEHQLQKGQVTLAPIEISEHSETNGSK